MTTASSPRDRQAISATRSRASTEWIEDLDLDAVLSRGFVEAMGGELRLEDTPGGGVTMIVRLPIAA